MKHASCKTKTNTATANKTKKGKVKVDVYQAVTDKIIASLEAGVVPWHKPWGSNSGRPIKLSDGTLYHGSNVFLLMFQGFESPFWGSYKELKSRGLQVDKGQKGSMIVFYKTIVIEDKKDDSKKSIPLIRYSNVFNADQCSPLEGYKGKKGMPINPYASETSKDELERIATCEEIVKGYVTCPAITTSGSAWYQPDRDVIGLPALASFCSAEEYYCTLFHELGHSTGSKNRCNRKMNTNHRSKEYATEELIAELTASFLCGTAGVLNTTLDNSTAYIQNWLKRFRGDKKLLVGASSKAGKATDYILNLNQ